MKTLLLSIMIASLTVAQETTPPQAETEEQTTPDIMIGEVTGDNVNVRSGPSTNYYLVTRLNKGDRVLIYERKHGWLAIKPPKVCFSLVAKQYVDLDIDKKTGVINADHVWIHAGSDLSKQTYAKQPPTMNRGQLVEVVGELDQFYKIVPPENRRLWMSEDYIRLIEESTLTTAIEDLTSKVEEAAHAMPPLPTATKEESDYYKNVIEQIENNLEQEFKKDLLQRDLQRFIERFQLVAAQEADRESQQYAAYRITQLEKVEEHIEALCEMRKLVMELEADRQRFMKVRANIRPPSPPMAREFDVRGKLAISFAYDNPAGPMRYRILDPESKTNRTIAYVEFEPDSKIDPQAYLGRLVGVRSIGQHLIKGTVDSVVVYTVAEIVILEPPQAESDTKKQ